MVPLLAGSFIVPKTYSFEFQMAFRYLLPPIVTNFYLFGYSKAIAMKINTQKRLYGDGDSNTTAVASDDSKKD